MTRKPRILIVNDDGIHSEGIARLASAAMQIGDVYVAAPESQCSGMSQKLTLFDEISISEYPFPVPVRRAYMVGGTPADCVKAALNVLFEKKPDYVFSGINDGFNAGYDVAYSGTIGAAMEGLMQGIPSFAFSKGYMGSYETVDKYLLPIIYELLDSEISDREIWSVNFPDCTLENFRGILRDRSVAPVQLYRDSYIKTPGKDGAFSIRCNSTPVVSETLEEGTDIAAVISNHISIGKVRCPVR